MTASASRKSVMAKGKRRSITWRDECEAGNYPAALSYLSLIYDGKRAGKVVQRLRKCELTAFKAKDIFRASGLSLLGVSNLHVEKDRNKIMRGKQLSPLLLVRDPDNSKVIIADGYHRLCAVYGFDEDALICCK